MTGGITSLGRFFAAGWADVVKSWRVILRLSIAPALAWWLSMQVFGHGQAFFAPIAAILTLTVGVGQRLSVVVEIIIGAALGILIGELLILSIGRGSWQLLLVLALAVLCARFLRLPGIAVTQAVISAVLLVAIVPDAGSPDPALNRFIDALLGGAVGLAMIVLIPANPVREMDLGMRRLLDELADILDKAAQALRTADPIAASQALEQARDTQRMVDTVGTLADSVAEMARLSPFRWGQREAVLARTEALVDVDHAVRNTRVLLRRVAAMLRHHEVAPGALVDALEALAGLARDDSADVAELIAVSHQAIGAVSEHLTINTAAIASQVRAIVADMLLAAGTDPKDLDDLLDVS